MLHIVFAGNPGVGKSLLANTLIGRHAFESSSPLFSPTPSPETDTPTSDNVLQTVVSNGLKFSDTPGLDSLTSRARAAREISRAINDQTEMKLIFVVTLESGRVRPADVATIDVILSAVHAVNARAVDNSFSLIINRCDPAELELLRDQSVREFLAERFSGRFKLSADHVFCVRNVTDLVPDNDHDNLLKGSDRNALSAFVFDAPVLSLRPPVDVNSQTYDSALTNAANELGRLRTELDRVTAGSTWFWGVKVAVSFVFARLGRAAWIAVRALI